MAKKTTPQQMPPQVVTGARRVLGIMFLWLVMLAFVAVSSALNVRHQMTASSGENRVWGMWVGGAAPVVLFLVIEVINVAEYLGASGRTRHVALSALVPLAMVVFGISFRGLYYGARDMGFEQWSWGVAAVPDLAMVILTVYLVSLRRPSVKTSTESSWRRLREAAVGNLESRLTAPKTSATSSTEAPWSTHGGSILTPTEPPRGGSNPSVVPAVEPPPSSVASPVAEAKPSAVEPMNSAVEAFLPVGEWMAAEEVVARKTAVELATITEAISRGLSDNRVKIELGVSAGTADKVRTAWIRYQRLHGERPHLVTAGG